ncbi:MAG TPA: RNA polymerase sigma factor [Bacteroidota bacterium]|nr:RNA polymerase sigma factor [Bacteroidota bacterium]
MGSLIGIQSIPVQNADPITQAVGAERRRLFDFIRKRVRTEEDAEDILQDVLFQFVASYSVTEPIEKLTAWLFRVARNKIIDWYRKKRPESLPRDEQNPGDPINLEDILYDSSMGPDALYARSVVWRELSDALDDLPEEQRDVFVMHELEGRSFKEIAAETGEPINTLLSRKRYAVLALRSRLQDLYDEFETTT